jgi:hypothetical protein
MLPRGTLSGLLFVLLPLALIVFSQENIPAAQATTYEQTIFTRASFHLNIYGSYDGEVNVLGRTVLGWSDPYFNGVDWVIDTEILSMDLYGYNEVMGPISVRHDFDKVLSGQVVLGPSGEFPAESFFDVYMRILVPGLLPSDMLRNMTQIQIAADIDAMPPYFDDYDTYGPSPVVLYDQHGIPDGEMGNFRARSITYYEPKARVFVEMSRGSDIAVPEDDMLHFGAGWSGHLLPFSGWPPPLPIVPDSATFGIRELGDPGPFVPFFTDVDGSGGKLATTGPLGQGDGWSGYLDISAYSTLGAYYEVEVGFSIPGLGPLGDTLVTYIDPTPPIPDFITILPESIVIFDPDTTYDLVFTTFDEDAMNGEMLCFKLEDKKQRDLWGLSQYSLQLGDTNEYACLPTAAASCLQYWAENGYPELAKESPGGGGGGKRTAATRVPGGSAHPAGEPPPIGPYEMAEELAGAMGTDTTGTDVRNGVNGLVDYLGDRGLDDWYVAYARADDASDLAWALEEFEAHDQDVILVFSDTTADHSDTTGHAVTLGSHANGAGGAPDSIDFMDPKDGTSGEQRTYPVGSSGGRPTVDGYNWDGDGSAALVGFLEVSPPEEAGKQSSMLAAGVAQFTPGVWNLLDSGPVSGSGAPDTMAWNTTGFPAGTYLLEIRTTDAAGNTGRRLRMARVTGPATHAGDDRMPKSKTGLRGSFPNPFNPSTTIEFTLAYRTNVSLTIFDVSGRLVKRLLLNDAREAGVHRIEWNGLNDNGRLLASGVYFCKLETKSTSDEIKIILVK